MDIYFQYLFDAYPPILKNSTFVVIISTSIFLLVFSLIIKEYLIKKSWFRKKIDRYQKSLIIKISDIAITTGVINLFLIFFRKVRIPYFQMRFVLILWWIIMLSWLITAIQHYLVKVPKLRQEDAKRKMYEKYID